MKHGKDQIEERADRGAEYSAKTQPSTSFFLFWPCFFPPCSIAIMRSVQLSLKLSSPVYTLSLTQRAQHYTNMANRCFKHLAHQSIHKNKNETNKQKKKDRMEAADNFIERLFG